MVTHGSLCQDFSVAGNNKGGDEGSNTRSSLMWNTVEIVKHCKPKYVIWENVKNVLSKKHKHNFDRYIEVMEEAGYNNFYDVLNAKNYGVPQNRQRLFVISIRKDIEKDFEFPKGYDNGVRLRHILEENVDERYYISDEKAAKIIKEFKEKEKKNSNHKTCSLGNINPSGRGMNGTVYSSFNLSPTVTTNKGEGSKILVDEYASLNFVGGIGEKDLVGDDKNLSRNFPQGNRVYDSNGLACSQTSNGGGLGGPTGLYIVGEDVEIGSNAIKKIDIPQTVTVRKYEIDEAKLKKLLKESKNKVSMTCGEIATALNKPKTLVEHWFRADNCFSIPDADIWYKLKDLLNINTNDFDESITTFYEKEGNYEKSNRCYFDEGIAPTITCEDQIKVVVADAEIYEDEIRPCINPHKEKVYQNGRRIKENDEPMFTITTQDRHGIVQIGLLDIKGNEQIRRVYDSNGLAPTISTMQGGNTQPKVMLEKVYRVRKLTPLECWRLMSFTDSDFLKAKSVCSNSQLHKQAGNSIVVSVMEGIFNQLLDGRRFE